jgi:hypothetical protein
LRLPWPLAADGWFLVDHMRRLVGQSQPSSHALPGPGAAWALTLLLVAGIGAATVLGAADSGTHPRNFVSPPTVVAESVATARPTLEPPAAIQPLEAAPVVTALLFDPFFEQPQVPTPPAANATQPKQAGFEGIAVNAATGQPLSGVHVKLATFTLAGVSEAYGAMSGRDGRFSMASVAPGSYLLMPERIGFVHMMIPSGALPAASVSLKPGERIVDYRLEMTPRAVVAGRVTDEYGDPVPNLFVELTPVSPGAPAPFRLGGGSRAVTDDRGEFRISGGPGSFYVKATPSGGTNQPPEIRTDGTAEAIYGPTWYPGASAIERASVVARAPAQHGDRRSG